MSATSNNPYIGLRPFDVDESLLFFGRNNQTLELLQRLHQHHFVSVVGSSGSGKSSLIRAGLIPSLKAGYLMEDSDQWLIVIMKPGRSPLYNLAEAILSQIPEKNNAVSIEALVQEIMEVGSEVIVHLMQQIQKDTNINFFLLVDQFEELFRFAAEQKDVSRQDEAIEFVNSILELAKQQTVPFFVVITMRSDFIGDCSLFYGLPEAMNESQYLVPRLNRVQLKTVIEGPAKLFGGKLDASLTSRILNDLGKVKDELPLLQHALMRLWDYETKVHQDDNLGLDDYLGIGGLEKALCIHADEALIGMSDRELFITKRMFQSLTAIDSNGRKIRRPVLLSQLKELTGATSEELEHIIDCFIKEGRSFLIISVLGDSTDKIIDISHESFIRQWDKLGSWVDEEGESAAYYLQLVEALRLYQLKKKDLLAGSELQLMLDWRNRFKPIAVWANRYKNGFVESLAYLEASEQEQLRLIGIEKARKKKQSYLIYSIMGLLFAMCLAAVIATTILNGKNEEIRTALLKSKKIIQSFFFYDDKFAIAYNENKFYFINKEGESVDKLGQWDEAEQFDNKTGFAKVQIDRKDFLLDTNGAKYKVAYNLTDVDTSLEALDLSGQMQSELTLNPKKLTNLKVLIISNNNLTSLPIALTQLPNLTDLYADGNRLSFIPKEIGNVRHLHTLDLSGNRMEDLPKEIQHLEKLSILNLYDNILDSLPREIVNLKNLTELNIGQNHFEFIPGEIFHLENLISLNLLNIEFLTLPPDIAKLKQLQKLTLTYMGKSNLPNEFWQLTQLRELAISLDSLEFLPKAIRNFRNLTSISIVGGPFWRDVPDAIFGNRHTKKMELVGLNISELPNEIVQLKQLSYLDLHNNKLSKLPKQFGNLESLTQLLLAQNTISALPTSIGELSLLEVLNLSENRLGALPKEIGNLVNLSFLDLQENQITTLPDELFNLKSLQSLDLTKNRIHSIGSGIFKLTSLKDLKLGFNALSGLPNEIGSMKSLRELDLSDNQLNALPKELGKLKDLTSLDLSNNDLTALPFDFLSLPSLEYLNIKGNTKMSQKEILRIEKIFKNSTVISDKKR